MSISKFTHVKLFSEVEPLILLIQCHSHTLPAGVIFLICNLFRIKKNGQQPVVYLLCSRFLFLYVPEIYFVSAQSFKFYRMQSSVPLRLSL